ncbi:phosphoserine phosphatase SerB [uncultured Agrococcus sp.]|uniref:phosphoserine phosphatase SerB n=1 Tax=uncultured Agrococcus sp. TaxID=382258 RepID=UPI0025DB294B|nr:phosphoserine phosphatase SerB [uncultured Agrococcus sp.]
MAEPWLVVSDVDSTLIRDEVIELIADSVGPDARAHVEEVTERAMRGELDFADSLRERLLMLQGVPESVLVDVVERVRVTDGVQEFVDAVQGAGGAVAAVSGGFHEILDPLAARLGIRITRANRLEVENGALTGRSVGPVIDAAAKRDTLLSLSANLGIPPERTMAIGDGANDLLMVEAAGLGVAFCAKTVLREAADVIIDRPDFRNLLPHLT